MGFFLRGDDDKLYPLVADGNPVKYDENLADFLEYKSEAKSARAVVQGLFTNKDMALVQHQIRYTRWMADPSKDPNSEGDLLGEL
jgi:hypothetical protein